jgi:type VI secretion system protein ImpH
MEPIKLELLREGRAFSFFQIFRLLSVITQGGSGKGDLSEDFINKITVKPNLSLAFPASDVESVEEVGEDGDTRFQIISNMLGLYGSSSPLPTFYTEDLFEEEAEDESVSRDFVDIINHRLFILLFECWMKYRQFFQVFETKDSAHIERLFCLLGLGNPSFRKGIKAPHRLLRYLGLFTQHPHSAVGLKTILRDTFSGIDVDVISCIKRTARMPEDQRLQLGVVSCTLGEDSYLAREIVSRMGKFRIQLGPMNKKEFKSFYPGSDNYNRLIFLTELYFVEPLEYDLELIQAKGEALSVRLGDQTRATLGVDSFIFSSSETMGEIRTVLQPQMN